MDDISIQKDLKTFRGKNELNIFIKGRGFCGRWKLYFSKINNYLIVVNFVIEIKYFVMGITQLLYISNPYNFVQKAFLNIFFMKNYNLHILKFFLNENKAIF